MIKTLLAAIARRFAGNGPQHESDPTNVVLFRRRAKPIQTNHAAAYTEFARLHGVEKKH